MKPANIITTSLPLCTFRTLGGVAAALLLSSCGGEKSGQTAANTAAVAPPPAATLAPPPAMAVDTNATLATVKTSLPSLPPLYLKEVNQGDHTVSIKVAMMDGAVDYRVYPLPKDGDVVVNADGSLGGIKNAVYRCAGDKEVGPMPFFDDVSPYWDETAVNSDGSKGAAPRGYITQFTTRADNVRIGNMNDGSDMVTRKLSDATLGYVYLTAGSGRSPVYALGNPDVHADVSDIWLESLSFFGSGASRAKTYTTDTTLRSKLLTQGWRDDGIEFYAPSTSSSATAAIQTSSGDSGVPLYFSTASSEYATRTAHGKPSFAFNVLRSQDVNAKDSVPLMRVNVGGAPCWKNADGSMLCRPLQLPAHDELLAGKAKFTQVYRGQWKQPYDYLQWTWAANETPTTLVVEALGKNGCPFNGLLAPASVPAGTLSGFTYQSRSSVKDLAAKDPLGQVYINGQHDDTGGAAPVPIARSFVNVAPVPNARYDFASAFGSKIETWTPDPKISNFLTIHQTSDTYDAYFWAIEQGRVQMNQWKGSMWIAFSDWAADTGGVMQLTPRNVAAQMNANTFVHAVMDVDAFTTRRRYPQIIISDYAIPIGPKLVGDNATIGSTTGHALLLQTKHGSARLEVQYCDRRNWNTNNQCPYYDLATIGTPAGATDIAPTKFTPGPNLKDLLQEDLSNRYEIFASSTRSYVFFNGKPYGCADYGKVGGFPAGKVNVSYGQVQYHSSADEVIRYQLMNNINTVNPATDSFHAKHKFNDSIGHLDNFAYSSNVPRSAVDNAYNQATGTRNGWNEALYPCSSNQYLFTE